MSQEVTDRQRSYTLYVGTSVHPSHVDRQIMGILGQPIKESLLITDTQLGLLTGIMFAVFMPRWECPWRCGPTATIDVTSFRSRFSLSLMTALCATATNFMQLLLLRIGVGVGEAGSNPPSHSMIADLYPPEKRQRPWRYLARVLTGAFLSVFWLVAGLTSGTAGGQPSSSSDCPEFYWLYWCATR